MGHLRSFFFPSFRSDDVLDNARRRLVHIMCLLSAIVGAIFGFPEVMLVVTHGYHYVGTLAYILLPFIYIALSFTVRMKRGLKPTAIALLVGVYCFTLFMRFDTGFFVPGAVFFVGLPMLTGMLLGWRTGVFAALLVVVTYAGLYFLKGALAVPSRVISISEYDMQAATNYSVLAVCCAGCAFLFMHVMERVITQLKATNAELKVYKQDLEVLVDQRTETIRHQKAELEQALKAAEDSAILQNQLVSVVSHEIRTPLAIIDGAARRLAKRAGQMPSDSVIERTDVIRNSVQRLTHLMERTLDSARLADGSINMECRELSLSEVIHQVVTREKELHADFVFEIRADEAVDRFMGDRAMLDHLFSNLISNAIKYSSDKRLIEIEAVGDCRTVTVKVRDHGVGIPAGELSHISTRLFRASTAAGIPGTGIGLNLCKQIVTKHGGQMRFESELGTGTTVIVELPNRSCAASEECGGGLVCSSGLVNQNLKAALS